MLFALKTLGTGHYFWLGCRTLQIQLVPRAVCLVFKNLLLVSFSPQDYSFKSHTLSMIYFFQYCQYSFSKKILISQVRKKMTRKTKRVFKNWKAGKIVTFLSLPFFHTSVQNSWKFFVNKLAQYLAHLVHGSGCALSKLASGHWENKELPLEKINSTSQVCIPFKQGPSMYDWKLAFLCHFPASLWYPGPLARTFCKKPTVV